ncbi:hypothetical protein M409DRAFT_61083 [Zasmidium cellare ATCC 36951]|uniref:Rhodopsin domain-containing protein n=1 Tax=Zasmidium cellare ATCC 36951 TaxID=1080233 RepID=A0A6A6BYY9_ZASCE|nr:uncharacterized protein M409DRAFT_61083 [Zasmidium cellare ATCC 36951]KAF2159130.1 hypothetical protein M409DRAFT_61083 [Zasmidium cellare ATCC 36951]
MASPTNAEAIESLIAKPGALPPGTTAAFLEQSIDTPSIIGILFVASLVLAICLLRYFARCYVGRRFGLDDYLALVGLVCLSFARCLPFASAHQSSVPQALLSAFTALSIVLIHLGSGRHFVYIEYFLSNAQLNKTEILDFAAHIIYTTALLICRLSGLALYARITQDAVFMTRAARAAAAFMIATYLVQLFLLIFHCVPVTGTWPYSFQPTFDDYKCLQWGTVYVTNSAISLICDLILFLIPSAIIARLQVTRIRKVKLCLILMPGVLVIAITIARIYLVVTSQWNPDESWDYDILLAVEVSEIGSTLIALSIPALKPFLDKILASFRGFTSTSGAEANLHSSARPRTRSEEHPLELEERSLAGGNQWVTSEPGDEEFVLSGKLSGTRGTSSKTSTEDMTSAQIPYNT